MTNRKLRLLLILPLSVLLFAPVLSAQQQQSSTQQQTTMEDLKKQLQALTQAVTAMQKDIQDIKSMLQSRAPSGPPEVVTLDLANYPFRGSNTAKLTLVEFSDYQ